MHPVHIHLSCNRIVTGDDRIILEFLLHTYNPSKAQGLYSAAAFILKVPHIPYREYLPCMVHTFFQNDSNFLPKEH